ncbi:hypothetical protein ACET3Z_001578 [Daucus carota]
MPAECCIKQAHNFHELGYLKMATRLSFLRFLPIFLFLVAQKWIVMAMIPTTVHSGLLQKPSNNDEVLIPPDFKISYYTQTLDHFGYTPESYMTFQQRYVVNYEHWGGANTSSPIIVYTGDEVDVTALVNGTGHGFLGELASHFKAILMYIEHRYYGDSMPFGQETFDNSSTLGYFTSTQALADYAQLLTDLRRNLSAENCPVIAVGGSYGGMLASWFRLKYPHIAYAALASSAPILYFDNITPHDAYYVVSCYKTIKQSWSEIDKAAADPSGLLHLGQVFATCRPLNSSQELKDFLALSFMVSAQYDFPTTRYVQKVCNAIDGAAEGTDILGRVAAGFNVSALGGIFGRSCNTVFDIQSINNNSGWAWQQCTELVIPVGSGANDTMFEPWPFDIKNLSRTCKAAFGVTPRPHWITTEFGGHDIKTVLGKFASNIIFSNGLRDPYSAGGVLQDISDSLLAVYTEEGAHTLDISTPSAPSDPDWLVFQRKRELEILEGWLAEYGN